MRKNLANKDLRQEFVRHGLFQWQIARRLQISEPQLTRWLRTELPEGDERRQRILAVLAEAEGGGDEKKKEVDGATV